MLATRLRIVPRRSKSGNDTNVVAVGTGYGYRVPVSLVPSLSAPQIFIKNLRRGKAGNEARYRYGAERGTGTRWGQIRSQTSSLVPRRSLVPTLGNERASEHETITQLVLSPKNNHVGVLPRDMA